MAASQTATIYVDGSCSGNPGPAGFGYIIEDADGETLFEHSQPIGIATNNVAEYRAALGALRQALDLGYKRVILRSDSELLCKQVSGEYRIRNSNLAKLHVKLRKLMRQFDDVVFEHIRRECNKRSDSLARQATQEAKQAQEENQQQLEL